MVSSLKSEKIWVMDLGCSYHMCSRKYYFETLKLEDGEVVQHDKYLTRKVHDVSMFIFKMVDDCEFLLQREVCSRT